MIKKISQTTKLGINRKNKTTKLKNLPLHNMRCGSEEFEINFILLSPFIIFLFEKKEHSGLCCD